MRAGNNKERDWTTVINKEKVNTRTDVYFISLLYLHVIFILLVAFLTFLN